MLARAVVAACLLSASASAGDTLAGKSFTVGEAGQPICTEREELQEYILAMLKRDMQWISQLKSCGVLKSGIKVVAIEDYPSDSDIGHVVKVRAINARGSAVGYTLSIGLESK